MPDPEEKVQEHIRSISAVLYSDMVEEAYTTVWGYLLALRDFKIISERQFTDLNREASEAKTKVTEKLEKKKR